jgi:hypothetical protein
MPAHKKDHHALPPLPAHRKKSLEYYKREIQTDVQFDIDCLLKGNIHFVIKNPLPAAMEVQRLMMEALHNGQVEASEQDHVAKASGQKGYNIAKAPPSSRIGYLPPPFDVEATGLSPFQRVGLGLPVARYPLVLPERLPETSALDGANYIVPTVDQNYQAKIDHPDEITGPFQPVAFPLALPETDNVSQVVDNTSSKEIIDTIPIARTKMDSDRAYARAAGIEYSSLPALQYYSFRAAPLLTPEQEEEFKREKIQKEFQGYDENIQALDPTAYDLGGSVGVQAGLDLVMPDLAVAQSGIQVYRGAKTGDAGDIFLGTAGMIVGARQLKLPKIASFTPLTPLTRKSAKEGVSIIYVEGKMYIGQSKQIPKRVLQHFYQTDKLKNLRVEEIRFHNMEGSTKLEREIYEQYVIDNFRKRGNLLNKNNPMGGRLDQYNRQFLQVINKFKLPKFDE